MELAEICSQGRQGKPSTGRCCVSELTAKPSRGCRGEAVHREESHWWPSACLLGYYRKSFIACWQTGGTLLQSHLGGWQGKLWLWKSHPCITGVWSRRRHWMTLVLGKSCCRTLVLEELPCRSLVRAAPAWREIHFSSSVPLVPSSDRAQLCTSCQRRTIYKTLVHYHAASSEEWLWSSGAMH